MHRQDEDQPVAPGARDSSARVLLGSTGHLIPDAAVPTAEQAPADALEGRRALDQCTERELPAVETAGDAAAVDVHRADRAGVVGEAVLESLLAGAEVELEQAARAGVLEQVLDQHLAGRVPEQRDVEGRLVPDEPAVALEAEMVGDR